MSDTNKDADITGVGETKNGRRRCRIILVAVCRVLVFGLLLLTIFAVSCFLSKWLYGYASKGNNEQWLVIASSVLTGGLIVQLGLEFVVDLLKYLWDTVKESLAPKPKPLGERLWDFRKHAASLFLILFAVQVFTNHGGNDTGNDDLKNKVQQAIADQGYTQKRAELLDLLDSRRDGYDYARFPIFFNRAKLEEGSDMSQATDISKVEFSDGIKYIPSNNNFVVRRIVESLEPCGTLKTPVYLRVEGYASSAPFRKNLSYSEPLNVRVANKRRRTVEAALLEAIKCVGAKGRIVVSQGNDYDNLTKMEIHREFNDRPDECDSGNGGIKQDSVTGEAPPQDVFTRTAHIKIVDLGRCRDTRRVAP